MDIRFIKFTDKDCLEFSKTCLSEYSGSIKNIAQYILLLIHIGSYSDKSVSSKRSFHYSDKNNKSVKVVFGDVKIGSMSAKSRGGYREDRHKSELTECDYVCSVEMSSIDRMQATIYEKSDLSKHVSSFPIGISSMNLNKQMYFARNVVKHEKIKTRFIIWLLHKRLGGRVAYANKDSVSYVFAHNDQVKLELNEKLYTVVTSVNGIYRSVKNNGYETRRSIKDKRYYIDNIITFYVDTLDSVVKFCINDNVIDHQTVISEQVYVLEKIRYNVLFGDVLE